MLYKKISLLKNGKYYDFFIAYLSLLREHLLLLLHVLQTLYVMLVSWIQYFEMTFVAYHHKFKYNKYWHLGGNGTCLGHV